MSEPIRLEDLPEETQEILRAALRQEGAYSGEVSPEEFSQIMGQTHYLFKDDDVTKIVKDDSNNMKELLPALSHLIRTTRLVNENTIKEMKLRWRRALRLKLLVMAKPDMVSYAKFDAFVNFGYSVIEDARQGWRGKLVTERIKTYKIEGATKKKKFLGLF